MRQTRYFWVLISVLISLRFYFYATAPKPFSNSDNIRITANLRSEPTRYESSQYLKLEGLKIYLPLYPEVSYGDRIVVSGTVEGDTLGKPKLEKFEPSDGILYRLRKRLLEFYEASLPSDHAALIAGVTIGSKSGISQDLWEKLKKSGTAHVVVASGMNISLVGGFLLNIFILFFRRKKALVFALLGIWTYAFVSGFDAPIIRSAIMGSIAFTAQEFGRLNVSIRALGLSGAIMLMLNPGYLTDAGFLLSFFATLGLIVFERPIRKKLLHVPSFIREDLSTTLAAQVGVLPFLFYFFGQVNIFSPLINVLVLWTVVPMTILGMFGGLVGLFVPAFGRAVLFLIYPLSSWFINVVEIFG